MLPFILALLVEALQELVEFRLLLRSKNLPDLLAALLANLIALGIERGVKGANLRLGLIHDCRHLLLLIRRQIEFVRLVMIWSRRESGP